jgi:hypothetical protein
MRPTVVTLVGSTRFAYHHFEAAFREARAGRITLGIAWHPDRLEGAEYLPDVLEKAELDDLHLRRIDLAEEILVINVAGYVGESTGREIAYAWQARKHIRWLNPPASGAAFNLWHKGRHDRALLHAITAGYDPRTDLTLDMAYGVCGSRGPHLHEPGWTKAMVHRRMDLADGERCPTFGCFARGMHTHTPDRAAVYERIMRGIDQTA